MKTDYVCLTFALADMQLYQELDVSYPPAMLEGVVLTLLEYLTQRDQPKRELILMEERLKGIKSEIKRKVGLKARKELKKEVKKLGKLPVRKTNKPKKKGVK
jgi:hypothetical protein